MLNVIVLSFVMLNVLVPNILRSKLDRFSHKLNGLAYYNNTFLVGREKCELGNMFSDEVPKGVKSQHQKCVPPECKTIPSN
jgi:hypothetical protein